MFDSYKIWKKKWKILNKNVSKKKKSYKIFFYLNVDGNKIKLY